MADQTVTTTNVQGFAPVIAPYAESVLGQAANLVGKDYKSYADWARERGLSGDQVQAFTDLQKKSFTGAGGLGQDPYSQASAQGIQALAQKAGDLNYAGTQFGNQFQAPGAYQTGQFNYQQANAPSLQNYQMGNVRDVSAGNYGTPEMNAAQTGYNPQLQNYQMGPAERVNAQGVNVNDINAAQMGPAERVNTQSFAQPGSADAYMSPYMQNVVDIQKREAARQSGIQGTQQQAQAAQAGAFGGGRDAIMRAERERNLGQQLGDIQATGSQAAYQQAQQQFNTEQQARLQAQQANQQAGLTVGSQNLNAQQQANVQNAANQLQASGMNAQQAMQAALANQQAGITTGSQNLAANLGIQQLGTQTGLQTSLANLSNQQQAAVQNQAAQLQTQGMNAQQAMQAALANQQKDVSVGQQNLAANLQTQGLGAGQNLQSQLANQQAGLTTQQQQEQSRQFGAGQGMQAASLGAQYGLAGQQESERSQQFGANLGLQGLQAGMQGYGALGSQGQNLYGQNVNNLQLQNAFGTQQQQQGQNMLDVSQQNYAAEQNYPYKQVGFMSDIVNRAPVSQVGSTMTQPAPSIISQGLGAAAALYGAKKAKGGAIRSYRGAGLVDLALSGM